MYLLAERSFRFGLPFGLAQHTRPVSRQDFKLVKTLTDASGWIWSLAWGQQLLASAGIDSKIRIYDSSQDCGARLRWKGCTDS